MKLDVELFEYVLCYNALKNEEYLSSIIDVCKLEYFNNKDVKCILNIILDFYNRSNGVPNNTELKLLLTTQEQKESLKNVLIYFKTFDSKFDIDELLRNTEQFFREKATYHALLQSTTELSANKLDFEVILERFTKSCSLSLVDNLGFNYFDSIDAHCDQLSRVDNHVSTGWKWLDKNLGGGYLADGSALYVYTGFANAGKSIFLGNTAINLLKQNKNVLLITLEMSEEVYSKRISSTLSQIPFSTLSNNISNVKESLINFKNSHSDAKLIIKEFPTRTVTVNHINSFIEKLARKGFKPDVLVLDYINLIKGNKGGENSYEEIKGISEQLRASSCVFNIPVITATQTNRGAANKDNFGMEATSESIGLSYTSDVQIAIWASEEERRLGFINMKIIKNRYGPRDIFTAFKMDGATLSIIEMENNSNEITHVDNIQTNIVDDTLNKFG